MGCASSKVPAPAPGTAVKPTTLQRDNFDASQSASPNISCEVKHTKDGKTAIEFILELTKHKVPDASDVYDIAIAKEEISNIRRYARQFLTDIAADGGDDDGNANAVEVDDKKTRVALYDKLDLSSFEKESYPKSEEVKALIHKAIKATALFENENEDALIEVIDLFKPIHFKAGNNVFKQGDQGDHFYVVEAGNLSVHVNVGGKDDKLEIKVGKYTAGAAFGELALIFDSPRAKTVKATTDVLLWSLARQSYRQFIGRNRLREREEKLQFLRMCQFQGRPFNDVFDTSQIEDLSIALKLNQYMKGSIILREGEMNDTLYIIKKGTVIIRKNGVDHIIDEVHARHAFGTNALLKTLPSTYTYMAATTVVVYYLSRKDLEAMIGNAQDALDGKSVCRSVVRGSSRKTFMTSMTMDQKYRHLKLEDLEFFNVLGRGAFGLVILVQSKVNKKVFALKAQSKHTILKCRQTESVLNEYYILKDLDHPSILGMHSVMQGKRYLYFLVDLLPGGELMNYLKIKGRFNESQTRFYAATVVLAFEALHSLMIAYRDLKPENMVLDKIGYSILVDFGLAKEIHEGQGQTYTMCGTPDYLAPEVVRGTGHDWAVDYWCLGIFMFELTNGRAPFYSPNQLRRQWNILKGYEYVHPPSHFSGSLKDIIANLLENNQAKRLGRAQSGIQAIKNHRFFSGFDWEGLNDRKLDSPIAPVIPNDIKSLGKYGTNNILFMKSSEVPECDWWPDLKTLEMLPDTTTEEDT